MNYELFVELFRAQPKIDTDSEPELLELTLDEQDYVAGGAYELCNTSKIRFV